MFQSETAQNLMAMAKEFQRMAAVAEANVNFEVVAHPGRPLEGLRTGCVCHPRHSHTAGVGRKGTAADCRARALAPSVPLAPSYTKGEPSPDQDPGQAENARDGPRQGVVCTCGLAHFLPDLLRASQDCPMSNPKLAAHALGMPSDAV